MRAWYRNVDWSDAIAADFERRLTSSRSQKAQYLSLQGYTLIARYPAAAVDLLQRAIQLKDDFETTRALSFLALAQLVLGDVDAALTAYEDALERQVRQPNFIAVQPADYLFAVGVFERRDRLAVAEPIAHALEEDDALFGPDPQTLAAKALVFDMAGRGGDAQKYATRALPFFAQMPDVTMAGIAIPAIVERLKRISGSGG